MAGIVARIELDYGGECRTTRPARHHRRARQALPQLSRAALVQTQSGICDDQLNVFLLGLPHCPAAIPNPRVPTRSAWIALHHVSP